MIIEMFIDSLRFMGKHVLRITFAPFVGAVRELLKEGRYFESELIARWRAKERSHLTGHGL